MLRTLLLTTSALFAMARKRPWEPLLIMFAILLANAGLITVLLINEGATQGELLQREQTNDFVRNKNKAIVLHVLYILIAKLRNFLF